jgi:hypothetical protein
MFGSIRATICVTPADNGSNWSALGIVLEIDDGVREDKTEKGIRPDLLLVSVLHLPTLLDLTTVAHLAILICAIGYGRAEATLPGS